MILVLVCEAGGAVSGWPVRGKERFREINYLRRKFLILSSEADTDTVPKVAERQGLQHGQF